jgi:hypothetical protein
VVGCPFPSALSWSSSSVILAKTGCGSAIKTRIRFVFSVSPSTQIMWGLLGVWAVCLHYATTPRWASSRSMIPTVYSNYISQLSFPTHAPLETRSARQRSPAAAASPGEPTAAENEPIQIPRLHMQPRWNWMGGRLTRGTQRRWDRQSDRYASNPVAPGTRRHAAGPDHAALPTRLQPTLDWARNAWENRCSSGSGVPGLKCASG